MPQVEENPYLAPIAAEAEPSRLADMGGRDDRLIGWLHVAVAAAAMVATLPGRTHGLGLITEPLLADTGIERTAYADINLWATLIGALFCWPAGILLYRFGTRRVLAAISAALGAVVVSLSYVRGYWPLFVLIALTRALGQSMLSVASLTLVGKAFRERLGLAMGVYSLLVGLAFGAAFKLAGWSILTFGWRTAWSGIGLVLVVGLPPLAWLLVRDPPHGEQSKQRERSHVGAEKGATLSEALVSPVFWIFAVASSMYGLISSGIALFNQAILAERGFETQTYHNVLAVSSICGMAFNLAGGWAATRVGLGRLLSLSMLVLAGSLAALPRLTELWQVYSYAVALGAAGGIVTVSFFTVWGTAFGQTHLGKIQGWAQMMTVVASAAGPKLFAECHARTGSYVGVFYAFVPVALVLAVAAWLAKLPRPSAALGAEEELQLATP
ncbi:MAG: MFS transporter [Pirellulales bacterium]